MRLNVGGRGDKANIKIAHTRKDLGRLYHAFRDPFFVNKMHRRNADAFVEYCNKARYFVVIHIVIIAQYHSANLSHYATKCVESQDFVVQ